MALFDGKTSDGYMTVHLSLTLTVIVTLCLALIEGCRYQGIQLETECVMDIGMESLLAEYHRELFKQYNIFAIDCSYGSEYASTELTENHLLEYMNHNFSMEDIFLDRILYRDFFAIHAENAETTKTAFLTDQEGEVFRRAAINAIEDDVGIGFLQQIMEWMKTIESEGLEQQDIAGEKQRIDAQIQEYNGQRTADGKTIHIENPTEVLEQKRSGGILEMVLGESEISSRIINPDMLIETRTRHGEINHGNLLLSQQKMWEELEEKFFFHEYLLRYLGRYGEEKTESPLWYQTEYIIAGKNSDRENLREIVNRIFIIREAANAIYLMGSEEKHAIAEAMGQLLAAVLLVPEIAGLFTTTIILGWAFAESTYDVKMILSGEKIPLIKDDQTWHYDLSTALEGDIADSADGRNENIHGIGYEDYLRIFLMFCEEREITYRTMNVVEMDVRNTPGNSHFRLDACIAELDINVKVESKYGYSFEIERQKSYMESMEEKPTCEK